MFTKSFGYLKQMTEMQAKDSPEMQVVTNALGKYEKFRPSEVQNLIWTKHFVLFVEDLSVSFDGSRQLIFLSMVSGMVSYGSLLGQMVQGKVLL